MDGMGDQGGWEGTAEYILRRSGYDGTERPSVGQIATAMLGAGCVEFASGLKGDAALVTIPTPLILVKRKLPVVRLEFAIAHEVAEWALLQEGYEDEDIEQAADYIAAALIVPRRLACRFRVELVHEAAEVLEVTETHAALRIAEATGQPIALVSPAKVRVRGDEWAWPSDLRTVASHERPGLARAVLRDDPRRVLLMPG